MIEIFKNITKLCFQFSSSFREEERVCNLKIKGNKLNLWAKSGSEFCEFTIDTKSNEDIECSLNINDLNSIVMSLDREIDFSKNEGSLEIKCGKKRFKLPCFDISLQKPDLYFFDYVDLKNKDVLEIVGPVAKHCLSQSLIHSSTGIHFNDSRVISMTSQMFSIMNLYEL